MNASFLIYYFRPEFIHEIVGILEKMYENPAYIEDHPRPLEPFHLLEETVAVKIKNIYIQNRERANTKNKPNRAQLSHDGDV
jgi:hypothetical protein